MSSPTNTLATTVAGPAGPLEVLLDKPISSENKFVAVVCHPHPLFGGTMTNKVTHIVARSFIELDIPAVRFNFRGVGKSAGEHDDGRGETEDTLAIVRWAESHWPGSPIILAGFSFGAAMALRASIQRPVAALITVAPALRWLNQLERDVPACPWLILQGDRDELVNVDDVRAWAAKLARPPQLKVLTGAEHFFHGRLNELRDAVKEWVASTALSPTALSPNS